MIRIKFDGNKIDYIEIDDTEEEQTQPEPEEAKPVEELPKQEPKPKAKRHPKPFDTGKAMALRKAGWTLAAIADEMQVSQPTIAKHLKKAGIK